MLFLLKLPCPKERTAHLGLGEGMIIVTVQEARLGRGQKCAGLFSQGSFRTSGRVGHSAESQQPESRGRSEKGWNHETRPHIVSHSLMDPTFQEHWRLIFSKQF